MFYNARWYDPYLNRFAQADSLIPLQTQGTQAWDRYAYVNNNPLRYTDPSGHFVIGVGIFLGVMAIGAIAGATYSAYTQSQAGTGEIDGGKVLEAAGAGALITGGIVIAAAAINIGVVAAAGALTVGACADGDCTNEAVALGTVANNATQSIGDPSDDIRAASIITTESAKWTQMGQNTARGTFYGANAPIHGGDVRQIVNALSGSNSSQINILTGAHGSELGKMYQSGVPNGWSFYVEDLALKGSNVNVYNVYLTSKNAIENMQGNIICAWCFSQVSTYINNIAK